MSMTHSTIGKRTYKIILLGQSNTGKTSIIDRFVNDNFEDRDNPTIGIDFLGKNITHNGKSCRLQLWDTAGQERYRSLIPAYLKDAVCAIFVFDVSRNQTLQKINEWINLFKENRDESAVLIACGNKFDLQSSFNQQTLDGLLSLYNMKYFQTSALTRLNIESMFLGAMDQIIAYQQRRLKKLEEEQLIGPLTTNKLNKNQFVGESEMDIKVKSQSSKKKKYLCC